MSDRIVRNTFPWYLGFTHDLGRMMSALDRAVAAATDALLALQRPDGHWVFELEADATIPAEYVLLRHYLGEPVNAPLEAKIAVYLRRIQGAHGGWPDRKSTRLN